MIQPTDSHMNKACCATCRYWKRFPPQNGQPNKMGICCHSPPTVVCSGVREETQPPAILGVQQPEPIYTPMLHTYFPSIGEGGWCGQHAFDKGRLS